MQRMDPRSVTFPRGSEWRRWDLHVHTPFSALNNGFGEEFDAYAKELFSRAVEAQIAVIGVTDYFVIEAPRGERSRTCGTRRAGRDQR